MNIYKIISLVFKILKRTKTFYLTKNQDAIFTHLSQKYEQSEKYSYDTSGYNLIDFVSSEKLDVLCEQLEMAVNLTIAFCFFAPFILLNIIFWKAVSFTGNFSMGTLYSILILLFSSMAAFIGNRVLCFQEHKVIEQFDSYKSALCDKHSKDAEECRRKKEEQQRIHDEELRQKYLS